MSKVFLPVCNMLLFQGLYSPTLNHVYSCVLCGSLWTCPGYSTCTSGVTWGVYPAILLNRDDRFIAHGSQSLPLCPYKLLFLLGRKGTSLAVLQGCLFSGCNDVPIRKFWASDLKLAPLLSQLWLQWVPHSCYQRTLVLPEDPNECCVSIVLEAMQCMLLL